MARVGDRSRPRVVVAVTTYQRPEAVTDRDRQVLAFAVEMFGAPMAVVAQLVPGDRVARRVAARLEQARLAQRQRVAGELWLVPTARGIAASGLDYSVWRPAGWKLAHHATVARLRLHLEATYPEARWISERQIRRRYRTQGGQGRRADGALAWPDGTATGIEVELAVKAKRAPGVLSGVDRYADIVRQADPAWNAGCWWFCPARHVDRLAKRLADAGGGDRHQVYPLPEGVAS
jgi:hypothetical protein